MKRTCAGLVPILLGTGMPTKASVNSSDALNVSNTDPGKDIMLSAKV